MITQISTECVEDYWNYDLPDEGPGLELSNFAMYF
jgi:hypothetical protein